MSSVTSCNVRVFGYDGDCSSRPGGNVVSADSYARSGESALGKHSCCGRQRFAVKDHDVVGVVFDAHVGYVDAETLWEIGHLITPIRSCLVVWT